MNIIQQILSLSTDFFNTNMESLVTGQASLTDVTLAVQEFVQNLGREVLSAMLEQADEAIYETVKPQRTYQIKETARPRTLVTTFGEITFHRRYYRQKDTGRYTYLLDEWCQLPAYSRIEASCQARLAEHAKDMSYAKAAQISTPVPVSKQSVQRLMPVGDDPQYGGSPAGTEAEGIRTVHRSRRRPCGYAAGKQPAAAAGLCI